MLSFSAASFPNSLWIESSVNCNIPPIPRSPCAVTLLAPTRPARRPHRDCIVKSSDPHLRFVALGRRWCNGSRGCSGQGIATSPTGGARSRTTAASRFSRSAPSSRRTPACLGQDRAGRAALRRALEPLTSRGAPPPRRPQARLRRPARSGSCGGLCIASSSGGDNSRSTRSRPASPCAHTANRDSRWPRCAAGFIKTRSRVTLDTPCAASTA